MAGLIEITGLSKTFNTKNGEINALRDINISIAKGDIFGIIGLSGAGKSTLVRCINFLEKPTAGKVIFDGQDLQTMSPKELREARRSMGMIFQSFNLLEQRSALDNITFPLELTGVPKTKARERARELLKLVGLGDREKAYPAQLSGGQKQRIAIARALSTNPKVILCDEATSALDPTTTQQILSLLQEINQKLGVTIIVITHEMKVVETICNKVAVLDRSRVVEQGNVKEIFLNPQSNMARQLIFPGGSAISGQDGGFSKKKIRLVFDGHAAEEPIISQLTLACNTYVNIAYADTKAVNGQAVGQMLLQLPEDKETTERIKAFLDSKKVIYTEED